MQALPTLILASQSPRRAELLQRLSIPFETRPANIDEETLHHLKPGQMAQALAAQKAQAVWQPGRWVLAADTVVTLADKTLGKPANTAENRAFIQQLSGLTHSVFTGFAIVRPSGEVWSEVCETKVAFRNLSNWEMDWYAQSGEGLDKAGGYGAQELGMVLLEGIKGDFYTVMGLPVSKVWQRLLELGYFAENNN